MDFVSAKCPQCGGALQVPDDRDRVKCMYCGSDVLVREAIGLVSGDGENLLSLAKTAQEAGNFAEAYGYFTRVLEFDPKSSDAWVGKANCAGWQSNLIKSRFPEMLTCYSKAIDVATNDGMKGVIRLEAAVSILHVAKAYFNMSVDHLMQFISVPSAKYEHIDRCKDIVYASERACEYDPDLADAKLFIVDVCNRMMRLSGLSEEEKKFFETARNKYVGAGGSVDGANSSKSSSDCFVVTATMGGENNSAVWILRNFRESILRKYYFGKKFINWYCKNGPAFADMIRPSMGWRLFAFAFIVLPAALFAAICLLLVGKMKRQLR